MEMIISKKYTPPTLWTLIYTPGGDRTIISTKSQDDRDTVQDLQKVGAEKVLGKAHQRGS